MYRTVESAFEGQIGVARCDITPPIGIYSRMWGAAKHEVANSIHRPLQATGITFAELTGGDPLVLVALDLGWWRAPEDEQYVRHYVLEQLGLSSDRLMINLSHTHSGPSTSLEVNGKPGGALVRPYLDQLREQIVTIIGEAIADRRHATLSWATGRCSLATSRHLPAPDGSGELVAYRPSKRADDTLLVGRITTKDNDLRVRPNCKPPFNHLLIAKPKARKTTSASFLTKKAMRPSGPNDSAHPFSPPKITRINSFLATTLNRTRVPYRHQ